MYNALPRISPPSNQVSRGSEDSKYVTRSDFDRDRDRILYGRPFRRLSGKTQVFLTASHDYVRTRLTHTLEVAQLSRDIAGRLNLDVSLAEAIALGHDLGHTPFGHVGERALNELMNDCQHITPCQKEMLPRDKGFKHNLQSCRVAQVLSRLYSGEHGLNLTNFTLWGIANHSGSKWKPCKHYEQSHQRCLLQPKARSCDCRGKTSVSFYREMLDHYLVGKQTGRPAWSFEGYIVRLADEIAQRHHDLEDALVTRITSPSEIVDMLDVIFSPLLTARKHQEDRYFLREMKSFIRCQHRTNVENAFMPYVSRFILNVLKKRLVEHSERQLRELYRECGVKGASAQSAFEAAYPDIQPRRYESIVSYDTDCFEADLKLHRFLENRVLNSFHAQRMDGVGTYMVRHLAEAYMANPQQLPDKMVGSLMIGLEKVPLAPREPKEFGEYREKIKERHNRSDDPIFQISLLRTVCDHIASMTDRYAFVEYQQLYGSAALRTFDAI